MLAKCVHRLPMQQRRWAPLLTELSSVSDNRKPLRQSKILLRASISWRPFTHSVKYRHPWELLSILTPGFLAADHLTVLDQPLLGSDLQTLFLVDPLGSLGILR